MALIVVPPNINTRLYDVVDTKESLDEMFVKIIPVSWGGLLYLYEDEIRDAGRALTRFITRNGHELCPRPYNVFRSLALCPWTETKVVIIGQDPYYLARNGNPSATGCCFECRKGAPIERSLEHIFIVLKKTIPNFEIPDSGDLSSWAMQGVLLLNATLTTTVGTANAHVGVWEFFSKCVFEYLSSMRKNVVYLLWGKYARKLEVYIDKIDNLILEASHPVARGNYNTFMKCDHFNEANKYLEENNRNPVDWTL